MNVTLDSSLRRPSRQEDGARYRANRPLTEALALLRSGLILARFAIPYQGRFKTPKRLESRLEGFEPPTCLFAKEPLYPD